MTSFFENIETEIQTEIKNLEQFFELDIWPYVKEFFALLTSQVGSAAVRAAVSNIPEVLIGNESVAIAAVASAVAAALAQNAAADAQKVLSEAQAHLSGADQAPIDPEPVDNNAPLGEQPKRN